MLSNEEQKERWNKYLYNNGVLKNKYGIKDQDKLEEKEAIIVSKKILLLKNFELPKKPSYSDFKDIHKFLFGDLYEWAGTDRNVEIFKSEKVLCGLSVNYTEVDDIEKTGENILYELNTVKWDRLDLETKIDLLTKHIAKLWKNHSFREGNTRTTLTFMSLYCRSNNIPYKQSVIEKYIPMIRDTLVLASLDEYAEPRFFKKIVHEAITEGSKREKEKEKNSSQIHTKKVFKKERER